MKKSIKNVIMILSVCATSALAAMASGCSFSDKIKDKIEQACCEHEWNDGEITKETTCTEIGELTKTCTLCEKVRTEEIPLIEHTEVMVAAVAATCTEDGLTTGVKCSVCDTVIVKQEKVPAVGHIEVKDSAVAPTCLTAGKTEGSHCNVCDEILTAQTTVAATGHTVVTVEGYAATCTKTGLTDGSICGNCNELFADKQVIPALGHSYNEGEITTAPTCSTIGELTLTCSVCGVTTKEEIAKIAHVDSDEDGSCDGCNELFVETMGMTEVAVSVGDKVAGNWYRIYRDPDFDIYNESLFVGFTVSCTGTADYGASDPAELVSIMFVAYSKIDLESGTTLYSQDIVVDELIVHPTSFGSLKYYVYEDYVDIYIEATTYTFTGQGTDVVTIDETSEILSIDTHNGQGKIVRLV